MTIHYRHYNREDIAMAFGNIPTPPPNPALASAIAGGVIAVALIDKLMAKDLLTLDEAREVLHAAMRAVSPHVQAAPENFQASQIIGGLLAGKFSAR
jgi:hypothetical protein